MTTRALSLRRWLAAMCCMATAIAIFAQTQTQVSQERMTEIYDAVKTPYKYGLVVAPDRNDRKYDCPTVFREGDEWFMTYVCYNGKGGTDGRGYETWLATSDDLLHWQTLGRILAFPDGETWDANQRGGFPALIDMEWGGSYQMGSYKGKHWMTYIGGPGKGYEAVNAPLSIGIASTDDDITKAHQWDTQTKPLMSYDDKDAQWWEYMTQYKSTIYEMDESLLGYPFVMFYNAGGKDDTHPKGERIGIALSKNMKKWKRYEGNPVFAHDTDGTITGDAQIVRMGDTFVMFYFSAYNPSREYNAYNTFAASYDLVNWTDWNGDDLIVPSKPYDEMFAHKSYVVYYGGTVYHFYCAVNNDGQRGIALATSKPMGKSERAFPMPEPTGHRRQISLNDDWTIVYAGDTLTADIPLNLDDYYGALQKIHGNLHGEALFVKTFKTPQTSGKAVFLRFEGVGTYADIELNGTTIGTFDIGRTVETVDVGKWIKGGGDENILKVKIRHPAGITDMPWVCGGCSSEWGFSEGSQPFGIFRPVTLEITDAVRIEPFGVYAYSNMQTDSLTVETEVKNYGDEAAPIELVNKLCLKSGKQVARMTDTLTLQVGERRTVVQRAAIDNPYLWSVEKPYLYNVNTIIKRDGKARDSENTALGFRTTSWPVERGDGDRRFYLNGEPVFINGVCEYEHLFGQSHAFSQQQIDARIKEIKQAGFNALRDAHQPHNLRYGELVDREGILWWPQFSAHIWYDTPEFRESFKRHLVQWVKERRNSPSVILWGLQNESTLPADFAGECADLIRQIDHGNAAQRPVTTCNGGDGTDWNVVQNWSGTYGGNANNYGEELKRPDQLLNGEYGAWRTLGNHSGENYTEEKQCDLLELKAQQAESVKDSVCGHFLWLLNSHDNPGRRQPDEALRRVDKVGPFNYKGLLTPWEQPADAYYMYRSRYVPAAEDPMVYIVPFNVDDGATAHIDSLRVYSNCENVTLKAGGRIYSAQHNHNSSLLVFRDIDIDGGTLKVQARDNGAVAAEQTVRVSGNDFDESILTPAADCQYLYAVNCGGDSYTDSFGNLWLQDNTSVSASWGGRFVGDSVCNVSPYQTSQTVSPLLPALTLFRTSRFGRHNLAYQFAVPDGSYVVELYFIEPWYGVGAGEGADFEGLRLFDVAVNDSVCIHDLDIWAQARYGVPYKRTVIADSKDGMLRISFPKVNAGQAIISAIRIGRNEAASSSFGGGEFHSSYKTNAGESSTMWADFDSDVLTSTPDSLLPPRASSAIQIDGTAVKGGMEWTFNVGVAKVYALRWRYYNPESARLLHVRISDANGVIYKEDDITFVKTPEKKTKRRMTSITTGSQVNAGTYRVELSGDGIDKMLFEKLTVE